MISHPHQEDSSLEGQWVRLNFSKRATEWPVFGCVWYTFGPGVGLISPKLLISFNSNEKWERLGRFQKINDKVMEDGQTDSQSGILFTFKNYFSGIHPGPYLKTICGRIYISGSFPSGFFLKRCQIFFTKYVRSDFLIQGFYTGCWLYWSCYSVAAIAGYNLFMIFYFQYLVLSIYNFYFVFCILYFVFCILKSPPQPMPTLIQGVF